MNNSQLQQANSHFSCCWRTIIVVIVNNIWNKSFFSYLASNIF